LIGSQYLPATAQALGYSPVFLLNIDEYSGDPRSAIELCEHYKADVNSIDDILRAIEEHQFMDEVVAVTSLLDETLQNACVIAERYGIVGPDPALVQLTDKALVRKLIPELSPPTLTFTWSEFSAEKARRFFEEHNTYSEFVLKPGISSGGVGISILNHNTTGDEIRRLMCKSSIESAKQQNWIIQPRIAGTLYSLEGFVRNGQAFFLGFCKRVRKELTEVAAEFPVDKELSPFVQQKCQKAVEALVQRSGYLNGYFHCEFLINSDSVYFLDGNMGRIVGGAVVQQFALIYGIHAVEIYKHVFDLGLFKETHTQGSFQYTRISEEPTLSIYYCLTQSAIVLSVSVPANIISFHTQIASNGREIATVGGNDSAWVGFLAGFKETVITEIQQIKINTNKGSVLPFYMLVESQPLKKVVLNSAEGSH
jgi:hypothetical protein